MTGHEIHGYAIVSDDDMIADRGGHVPDGLRNDVAAAHFQAEFDRAGVLILGRASHEASPNPRHRRRLIVSSRARGLEQRPDGWWWDPGSRSLPEVLERVVPGGGRVAVSGGQRVFDMVLGGVGFNTFHIARAIGVSIPGGRPMFGAAGRGEVLESVLKGAGMRPGSTVTIDPRVPVELTLWRRIP